MCLLRGVEVLTRIWVVFYAGHRLIIGRHFTFNANQIDKINDEFQPVTKSEDEVDLDVWKKWASSNCYLCYLIIQIIVSESALCYFLMRKKSALCNSNNKNNFRNYASLSFIRSETTQLFNSIENLHNEFRESSDCPPSSDITRINDRHLNDVTKHIPDTWITLTFIVLLTASSEVLFIQKCCFTFNRSLLVNRRNRIPPFVKYFIQ